MNALKWLAVGAVVCLPGTDTRAEDKIDYAKMMLGKWEATKPDEGTLPKGAIVEFLKDGKMKLSGKKDDVEINADGTYKQDGNKVSVTLKLGDEAKTHDITIKKISATEMTVEDKDGKAIVFTKKK